MANGADIQLEKGGFTRIHNAILEQLARTDLTGRQFRVLLYIIRRTYGYQCKETAIGLKEFEEATGIDFRNVDKELRELVRRKIVYRLGGGRGRGRKPVYGFNKYFEQWQPGAPDKRKDNTFPAMNLDNSSPVTNLTQRKFVANGQENSSRIDDSTSGLKKRKKAAVKKEPEAAAASFPRNPFIAAYERIWGVVVPSEYVAQEIAEWEQRVTLDAWCYGLQECADNRMIGKMKYLRSILRRVEQEGMTPTTTPSPSQVEFTLEQLI